jgi:hypothetical protein
MRPEIQTKWLAALRGGEYQQSHGALKRISDDGSEQYCPLGILCELYRAETGAGEWVDGCTAWRSGNVLDFKVGKGVSDAGVHPLVAEWAGLKSNDYTDDDRDEWEEGDPPDCWNVHPMVKVITHEGVGSFRIAEVNDSRYVPYAGGEATFQRIADLIETSL